MQTWRHLGLKGKVESAKFGQRNGQGISREREASFWSAGAGVTKVLFGKQLSDALKRKLEIYKFDAKLRVHDFG